MSRRWALASGALAALSLAACENNDAHTVGPKGSTSFDRYVAMGTSVSMGTQSDGVVYFTQVNSWPAQLAHAAMANFTQPLISTATAGTGVGCPAPLIAPLQLGRRYGTQAATLTASDLTSCSPLFANITLPTNNVAIDGARAYSALYLTPDSAVAQKIGRGSGALYTRVLPAGKTQVTTMKSEAPTLVSVEFGANELLGISSGILVPSTTGKDGSFVPLAVFQPIYDKIIDSVKATGAKVLLVAPGVTNVSVFPLFRTGAEIAADQTLRNFKVVAGADCSTTNANNLIALPKLLGTISAASNPAVVTLPFSCADTPGTQDAVLTPGDAARADTVQQQITAYIKQKATDNGFAYMELGSLYNIAKAQAGAFNAATLLGSPTPYGALISLDGVHPSNAGHRVLAQAAAAALNAKYGFDITVP